MSWLFGVDLGRDDGSSTLFRIDPSSGDLSVVGETGLVDISDITFVPDGQLFGSRFAVDTDLLQINPRTAQASVVGPIGFVGVNALVADSAGALYGATQDGELISIDRVTGVGTSIGLYGSGLKSVGDLAFDERGVLYGTATTAACCDPSLLVTIDINTGAATEIGDIVFDDVFGTIFWLYPSFPNGVST